MKVFLREKPCFILELIGKGRFPLSKEIRKINFCTQCCLTRNLRKFEDMGLIEVKQYGMVNRYSLTKKGKKINKGLMELRWNLN